MLNLKLRMKFLKKIAQTVDEVTEAIEKPIDSKIENLSAPEEFSISTRNPSLRIAFSDPVVEAIDNLTNKLNKSLYFTSLGKYDMTSLVNEPNMNATDIASRDFKPLFLFSKIFFEVMNAKFTKKLTKDEFIDLLTILRNDSNLNNFSSAAVSPELQNKIQINNIKSFIISNLDNIKSMAPAA